MAREEFLQIISKYQRLIYQICHAYCSNPSDHPDLEQEILVQIWRSLKKFDNRVQMSTWIYRVALNTAIRFYHNNKRSPRTTLPLPPSIIALAEQEYDALADEQLAILYQFIDQLDGINKALMLLYLEDKRYREIADILGISESNVATKINRIKQSFRDKLSRQ